MRVCRWAVRLYRLQCSKIGVRISNLFFRGTLKLYLRFWPPPVSSVGNRSSGGPSRGPIHLTWRSSSSKLLLLVSYEMYFLLYISWICVWRFFFCACWCVLILFYLSHPLPQRNATCNDERLPQGGAHHSRAECCQNGWNECGTATAMDSAVKCLRLLVCVQVSCDGRRRDSRGGPDQEVRDWSWAWRQEEEEAGGMGQSQEPWRPRGWELSRPEDKFQSGLAAIDHLIIDYQMSLYELSEDWLYLHAFLLTVLLALPSEAPEEEYDPRSLFDRLQEQKDKKQEDYEEQFKFSESVSLFSQYIFFLFLSAHFVFAVFTMLRVVPTNTSVCEKMLR